MLRDDPGFTWPRKAARKKAVAQCRGSQWVKQNVGDVHIFHFSGNNISPWWYAHMSPSDAFQAAEKEWRHRDPRKLIATAVFEWCTGFHALLADVKTWADFERSAVDEVVGRILAKADALWA